MSPTRPPAPPPPPAKASSVLLPPVPASIWEGQIQQLGRAVSFTVTIPLPMDGRRSQMPPATCARRTSRSPGASTLTPSAKHAWPSRRCGR